MMKTMILSALAAATPLVVQADMTEFFRIVGGNDAEKGDYPYYAQLGGCGGTLILPDVVLTAAHCPNPRKVIIGNSIRDTYNSGNVHDGDDVGSCAVFERHENYQDENDMNNDFALCKLRTSVNIDQNSVKLEVNFDTTVPDNGEMVTAIGMGTLEYGGAITTKLQWVDIPSITNEKCSQRYGGYITDAMMCAAFDEGGKDSCQGDSGGPLVVKTDNGDGTETHTHVGVVSWGAGCAYAGSPGVYSRVSDAEEWIKRRACALSDSEESFCATEEPTDPPVDPTDPPVDPTDPPVDPTDPPVDDTEDPTQSPTYAPTESPTEPPTGAPTVAQETCEDTDAKLCSKLISKFAEKGKWGKLKKKCKKLVNKKKPSKGMAYDLCPATCALVDVGPCA